jgi:hypothetical protein
MRVVVEGAGDQHVGPRLGGLAGGGDEVHTRERNELRADQDAGATLGLAFQKGRSAPIYSPGQGCRLVKWMLSAF